MMSFPWMRWCAALPLVFVVGCGDDAQTTAKNDKAAAPPAPKTERERQINNIQAAGAVGYDGQALKKSVQTTADAADKRNDDLQKAAEAAGFAEPADPNVSK